MAQKIMVASGKGGVGKSTVCLWLGAGLCAAGKNVLVLETGAGYRGLDIAMGLENKALYDLSDLLEGRCSLEAALLRQKGCGVELICAPNDPEYLPGEEKLAQLMEKLDEQYDFILADCGSGFGPMQGLVARRCDSCLLVTTPDRVAVRAAAQTSSLARAQGLQNQLLCINRIPMRLPESSGIRDLDDVIDIVGVQLLGAIPEGVLAGRPKRELGQASEELYRMAERLCGNDLELTIYR